VIAPRRRRRGSTAASRGDLAVRGGLAAGILLDATVVRALIVPAVVSLLGRAKWWWPGRPLPR
jgi:uncharacterized membrane protein YdfJ with MMPL/SSD domain